MDSSMFRSLVEATSAGIFILDRMMIRYANPAAAALTGYSLEELIDRPFWELAHPDQREMLRQWQQDPFSGDLTAHFEVQIIKKDGQGHWLDISTHSIAYEGQAAHALTAFAVTKRGELEEAQRESMIRLRQAQELLEAVTKGTEVIIAAVDMNYCYTFFNQAYREEVKRLSGKDIIIGASMAETFAHLPEQQKVVLAQWSEVLGGKSTNRTLEFGEPGLYQRVYNILHTPILDSAGAVVGAGEVAYDITDRVGAEQAQRESEQRYTTIFDRSPFAMALTKMPEGTIVNVNEAFLTQFDYTREELIGKTSLELGIADADSRAWLAKEMEARKSVHDFECIRMTKTGARRFLSLYLDWVSIGGIKHILTTIHDITDRKQAEQALAITHAGAKQERKRLLAVMEALPVGVAILDAQGGNIQSNRAFEDMWGSPRPPAHSIHDYAAYQAWWEDSGAPVLAEEWASAQAVRKGVSVVGQFMKIRRFDGSFAHVLNSAAPIFDQSGQVIGCAVAMQDVSEIKQRENEVRQLNRTLKALSNSNQAMMRAVSEMDYLNEVCHIIVEDCGYTMVWIGYAEDDEQKSVRPVASAGFERGYLDALHITWADSERGRGPTGSAIRTGKPSRCNNMLTDPKFAPWREAALKRGYASSIVLPLMEGGRAFGALNIYARQPEAFSEAEEKLLAELATDLSFGIAAIRLQEEHDRAEIRLAYLASFPERNPNPIVEVDLDGKIHYANSAALQLFPGLREHGPAHGWLARWKSIMHQIYESKTGIVFRDVAIGDRFYQQSLHFISPEGLIRIYGTDITDRKKAEIALGQARDVLELSVQERTQELDIANNQLRLEVAERRRTQEELERALHQEQEVRGQLVQAEKFAAVGRMLASITHEINNPLQTIKNCLFLSRDDTNPDSPVHEYLNMASAETDRLSNLVAQLREVYRPPTKGQSRTVCLTDLLAEVHALLASHLQDKHVSWIMTPQSALVACGNVEGVPDQLKQVFLNISLNAIEAMQPGGGNLLVDLTVSEDGTQAGVCFCDTGPGMPPEVKARLFEPFITTKEKGLGLGLAICYDIIKRHNGHIEAESQPGEGATFTVWLPLRMDEGIKS